MIGWILIVLFGALGWQRAHWHQVSIGIACAALGAAVVEGIIIANYSAQLGGDVAEYGKVITARTIGGLVVLSAAYWSGRGLKRWKTRG